MNSWEFQTGNIRREGTGGEILGSEDGKGQSFRLINEDGKNQVGVSNW